MQQNNLRSISMSDEDPKVVTIQQIFDARSSWRAANIAPLSDDLTEIIDDIRKEVKSGATADGWYMAGAGKSSSSRTNTKHGYSGGGQSSRSGGSSWQQSSQKGGSHSTDSWGQTPRNSGGGAGGYSRNNYDKKPRGQFPQITTVNTDPVIRTSKFYNSSSESFAKMAATEPIKPIVEAPPVIKVESPKPEIKKSGPPVFRQYKPRFTNSDYVEDDSPESKMLLNIQAAINKLVEDNYDNLKRLLDNFLSLDQNSTYLSKFMKMIFNSAIRDKLHCQLFAKLLFEMSQKYTFLQTEMNAKYEQFISTIFHEIEPIYETDSIEIQSTKNANREMRQGYSQFITELLKYNVIDDHYFLEIIKQIITTISEQSNDIKFKTSIVECAECLKTIIQIISKNTSSESCIRINKEIRTKYLDQIKLLSEKPFAGITPQAQFILMDITDLFI